VMIVLWNVQVFCFLIPWLQILVIAVGTFHIVWSCRKVRFLPHGFSITNFIKDSSQNS
jgi:hypothetical protein